MPDFILGLDLGKLSDHTALAVVRRTLLIEDSGLPRRDHRGTVLHHFAVQAAKRYKKHTSYPEVVAHVRAILERPELQPRPRLVVDATGVGSGVMDMLLDARLPAEVIALTITGGNAVRRDRWPGSRVRGWWVAKHQLVSATQAALQSDRLKVSKMPHEPGDVDPGDILRNELKAFTVKLSRAANDTYQAREGEHDDLLLAVAMPVFLGGQPSVRYDPSRAVPGETAALKVERERELESLERIRKHEEEKVSDAARKRDEARRRNFFDPSWKWTPL